MQDFDTAHNVSSGKHLYQFYKTAEDYLVTVTGYLEAGLKKGEAALWIVSANIGLERARSYAAENMPRYAYYLATGQLQIFSGESWYLNNGRFDEEQALRNAEIAVQKVIDDGFPGLRGTGDAAAIPHKDWSRLAAYEEKVQHLIWQSPVPIIGLCTYPILDCALGETKMVLDHHDGVLIGRV